MKKGFTLIELLAVIVILAIIALIATPIVMNTIEKSKKSAAERSAENYVIAVENTIAEAIVDRNTITDGMYTINSDGNITDGYKTYTVNVSGTKPTDGTIYIQKGEIVDQSFVKIDDRPINIVDGAAVTVPEKAKNDYSRSIGELQIIVSYPPGATYADKVKGYIQNQSTTIKYDPVNGAKCTSGATCYEWYVLEDKGIEYTSVSLILNQNISTNKVSWINKTDYLAAGGPSMEESSSCRNFGRCYTNEVGPVTTKKYLANMTSNWKNTAYLPTKDQITNAYTGTMPNWLINYPSGNNYDFWTSTAVPNNTSYVYAVLDTKIVGQYDITIGQYIRPIINVSKSVLNA